MNTTKKTSQSSLKMMKHHKITPKTKLNKKSKNKPLHSITTRSHHITSLNSASSSGLTSLPEQRHSFLTPTTTTLDHIFAQKSNKKSSHKKTAHQQKIHTINRSFFHSTTPLFNSTQESRPQHEIQKQFCWNCPEKGELTGLDLFCPSCKKIQAPEIPLSNQDYFSLYQLPILYNIDKASLERQFRSLQQSLHPDLFSSKSEKEQEIAADYSSFLNRSFEILSDDMLRAKYILFLQSPDAIMYDEARSNYEHSPPLYKHGLSPDDEQNGDVPLEVQERQKNGDNHYNIVQQHTKTRLSLDDLEDIFEKRDIAEECEDMDVLLKVFRANGEVLNGFKKDLTTHLDEKRDVEKALFTLELFHYYRNLQFELLDRIPSDLLTDDDRRRF